MTNQSRNKDRYCGRFFTKLVVAAVALLSSLGAVAQDELDDDREIERRRESTLSMSELVYRRLSAVHEELGEDQLEEALEGLANLEKMRLNKYEEALTQQTYGFVYVRQDKHTMAIASFEKCLALNALPNLAQQGMLYSLASLYVANERFLKAIETMRVWFQFEPDPAAFAQLQMAENTNLVLRNIALSDRVREMAFYHCQEPQLSSVCWPNSELLERFPESDNFRVRNTVLRPASCWCAARIGVNVQAPTIPVLVAKLFGSRETV